jgi:hypothetical protein
VDWDVVGVLGWGGGDGDGARPSLDDPIRLGTLTDTDNAPHASRAE